MSIRRFDSFTAPLTIMLSLLLLGLGAQGARAQVAAPSLAPFGFVTENPAVMQWGAPSRVGVELAQFQQVQTQPGTPSSTSNDQFYGAGVRLVGNNASVAVEGSHVNNTDSGSFTLSNDMVAGALGFRLGPMVTFGLAQTNNTLNITGTMNPEKDSTETPAIGVSIRLGEWFFLGAGEAREYLVQDTQGIKVATYRDQQKYGVGIRTGTTILVHAEYYYIGSTNYADPLTSSGGPFYTGKETQGTGVLEAVFGPVLVGYRQTRIDRNTNEPTTDIQRVDIGWVPRLGLAIVLHAEQQTQDNPLQPGLTITGTLYGLNATYLF